MRFIALCTALCLWLLPAVSKANSLARGQEVVSAFFQSDMDSIWSNMTPEMQAALGTIDALTTVRADLRQAYGSEGVLLTERMVRQGQYDVYERIADWADPSQPLLMTIAFDQDGLIAGFRISPDKAAAQSRHLDYQTKARLRLPFDGAWYVFWGGRRAADNAHAVNAGQRFAVDLIVLENANNHVGDHSDMTNYHCWDRPVLAPADGRVVAAIGDQIDQPIGSRDPQNPAGNHVVIEFAPNEYGFLAHLRQGSVTVGVGDQVTAGMEIGRCGNSGNSSEPHLHFHLQTSPKLGQGEGLPAQFHTYLADGRLQTLAEPHRGQTVEHAD